MKLKRPTIAKTNSQKLFFWKDKQNNKSLERAIETKKRNTQITSIRNKKWNVDTGHIENLNHY